jgi:hypothetical protein
MLKYSVHPGRLFLQMPLCFAVGHVTDLHYLPLFLLEGKESVRPLPGDNRAWRKVVLAGVRLGVLTFRAGNPSEKETEYVKRWPFEGGTDIYQRHLPKMFANEAKFLP